MENTENASNRARIFEESHLQPILYLSGPPWSVSKKGRTGSGKAAICLALWISARFRFRPQHACNACVMLFVYSRRMAVHTYRSKWMERGALGVVRSRFLS